MKQESQGVGQEAGKAALVLSFEELSARHIGLVGGKGANLGEMTGQGFPVPEGFCVTTEAFRLFVEGGGAQMEGFYAQLEVLDETDLQAVRALGKAIRGFLHEAPIPKPLEEPLKAAWQALGEEEAYAVRSSATAEDLPDASFAGQQDTYLNVRGWEALLERVRACWASLFTDRAIIYRSQNGFAHREVLLSVVVQRMVFPEVSGIMFTADPISGHRGVTSIDAGFGLGEALVSGKVSADLYKVDKSDWRIQERQIADKHMAILPLPEGGVHEVACSEEQRHAQVLSDTQIVALAQMGSKIEAHYGSPQDIEWCFVGDELTIVQSRPITSLYPVPSPPPEDGSWHVYLCFNHLQVMLKPIAPLGVSVWRLMLPFGKGGKSTTETTYITEAAGRLYLDFTEALRHKPIRKVITTFLSVADALMQRSLVTALARPRFLQEAKTARRIELFATMREHLLPLMGRIFKALFFMKIEEGHAHKLELRAQEMLEALREKVHAAVTPAGQLKILYQEYGSMFDVIKLEFFPLVAPGMIAYKMIGKLSGRPADDPDLIAISQGLSGNVTTEMDLEVADLADVARAKPALVKFLRVTPVAQILERLDEVEGGAEFHAAFTGFLDKYGMRGASEIDITQPRWRDDPSLLLQTIVGNLAVAGEPGEHRRRHKQLEENAKAAVERLRASASRGLLGWLKGWLMRRFTKVQRELMGGRETPKFFLIRMMDLLNGVLDGCAAELIAQGALDSREDLHVLGLDEIIALLDAPPATPEAREALHKELASRRATHVRNEELFPPRLLTSEGESIVAQHEHKDLPEGALAGSPASGGIVEGIARVILDPSDAVLHAGEILVAPFTDPGWTPLFIHAAGLVMEVGGLMTHGSVVAREYGIPAVVCVPDVTKRIQSGQRIRVDGSRGFVEFLEEDEDAQASDASDATDATETTEAIEASEAQEQGR